MLPSRYRIPSYEIGRILRRGFRVSDEGVSVVIDAIRSDLSSAIKQQCPKFAFLISSRVDKRSTERNRIKRLLQESVRQHISRFPVSLRVVCVMKRAIDHFDAKKADNIVLRALDAIPSVMGKANFRKRSV